MPRPRERLYSSIEIEDPIDEAREIEERDQVASILSRLSANDRRLICLRYGLEDGRARTLEKVATVIHCKKSKVHRRLSVIEEHIRFIAKKW